MRISQLPGLSFLRGWEAYDSFDFCWYGRSYAQAALLVRVFYLFLLYWLATVLIGYWADWRTTAAVLPLWPVAWLDRLGVQGFIDGLSLLSIGIMIAVVALPHLRWLRIGAFICFLLWYAFINSFGKISHDGHGWLFTTMIFIWLPSPRDAEQSVSRQHLFLTVFASAQVLFMLFYTMSGAWKIGTGLGQMLAGEIGSFHPHALAQLTAFRLLQTGSDSLLGSWIIQYPLLGWPLHLAAIYLEFFALLAAFRPSLHRLWGIGLIAFHFGTWLLMGIIFQTNIALLGLLMVMSPFYRERTPARVTLGNLPLLGHLFRSTTASETSSHSGR